MTERDLNKLIQSVVRAKLPTGSVVIRAKQNAPRPNVPLYASVNVLTLVSEGWEDFKDEDDPTIDINRTHTAMVRSLISVNFFGLGARQQGKLVRMCLTYEAQRALFAANGVGLIKRTAVKDLSRIRHADYEERAHFDLEVYHHFVDEPETITETQVIRIEGEAQEPPGVRETIIIEETV